MRFASEQFGNSIGGRKCLRILSVGLSEALLDIWGQFIVNADLVQRKILDAEGFIPLTVEPVLDFRFREENFFNGGCV